MRGRFVVGVVMVFRDGTRKRFDEADVDRVNVGLGVDHSELLEGLSENVASGQLELSDGTLFLFRIATPDEVQH